MVPRLRADVNMQEFVPDELEPPWIRLPNGIDIDMAKLCSSDLDSGTPSDLEPEVLDMDAETS